MKHSFNRLICNNTIKQSTFHIHTNSFRSITNLSHLSYKNQYKSHSSNQPLLPSIHSKHSFYTFVQQYERAVTLTFGKLTSVKEPGFRLYFPILQTMYKVDMRTSVHELLPQHIITSDNVSCAVTAVVYYHVLDAEKAVLRITDVHQG